MKILLSAYACEPDRGSEPGVGWQWAIELAKLGHDVCVITRANNQQVIEEKTLEEGLKERLTFVYYDLPRWASFWKKAGRGVHLYYFLWQLCIFPIAKKLHKKNNFDVAHHVTFVSVRQPSFLGLLGIPFVFGPVAGGDRIPWGLRRSLGIKGYVREGIRDIVNIIVRFDPFMLLTFHTAEKIYVNSNDTRKLIPAKYQYKVKEQLAIGLDEGFVNSFSKEYTQTVDVLIPKFLYVGRLDCLKGLNIAILAFKEFTLMYPKAIFTIVGDGQDKSNLKNLVSDLKLENNVLFLPWMEQSELWMQYMKNDFFIFPSLRDSGGMVVLEALAFNLPVVCFSLGGPSKIINNTCGKKIILTHKDTISEASEKLCEGMVELNRCLECNMLEPNKNALNFLSNSLVKNIASTYEYN